MRGGICGKASIPRRNGEPRGWLAGRPSKPSHRSGFDKFSPNWAQSYSSKVIRRLEICVFPWIGKMPISQIKAPDLLSCLRRVEARSKLGTAHRALQVCGRVFRYAVATGRAERDPSGDLRGALPPKQEKHHASFTDPTSLGDAGDKGSFRGRCVSPRVVRFGAPQAPGRSHATERQCRGCGDTRGHRSGLSGVALHGQNLPRRLAATA
jgi:hypothetical protein